MATIKLAPLCAAIAITASGVFLIASPSSAKERPVIIEGEPVQDVATRRVGYADLNLASRSGKKLLFGRVSRAVVDVCNEANPLAQRVDTAMCRDMSWDGARPQIASVLSQARELASRGGSPVFAGAISITAVR